MADIQPSNYNPRKNFDVASLAELAESIRQQGVLQPIGVRPIAAVSYTHLDVYKRQEKVVNGEKTKESTKEKPLSHLDRILETLNIEGYNFECF